MYLCPTYSLFDFEGLLEEHTPGPGYRKTPEGYQARSIEEISSRAQWPVCHIIIRDIACYWPCAPRNEVIFISVCNVNHYQHLRVHSNLGLDFEVDKTEQWKLHLL